MWITNKLNRAALAGLHRQYGPTEDLNFLTILQAHRPTVRVRFYTVPLRVVVQTGS